MKAKVRLSATLFFFSLWYNFYPFTFLIIYFPLRLVSLSSSQLARFLQET